MSIFFLRHIKTTYNQKGVISGQFDAEPLPNQSLVLPPGLSVYFDRVISSPSKRCRATIELLPINCYDSIEFTDQLIERNVGILESLSKQSAIAQYPHLFCDGNLDINAMIPNGESIMAVAERVLSLSDEIVSAPYTSNILICSHNQTLKVLYALLKNIPLTNDFWNAINFKNGTLVNISEIRTSTIYKY